MAVVSLDVGVMEFAKAIDTAIELVCQKIALDLWTGITLRTPVDTGRARASWQLATGMPSSVVPPVMPGGGGLHKEKSAPPDQPPAPFPSDVAIDGTDVIFITSNLPYIEPLEDGHSKQAVAGMVEVSMAEVVAEIQLTLESIKAQVNP